MYLCRAITDKSPCIASCRGAQRSFGFPFNLSSIQTFSCTFLFVLYAIQCLWYLVKCHNQIPILHTNNTESVPLQRGHAMGSSSNYIPLLCLWMWQGKKTSLVSLKRLFLAVCLDLIAERWLKERWIDWGANKQLRGKLVGPGGRYGWYWMMEMVETRKSVTVSNCCPCTYDGALKWHRI